VNRILIVDDEASIRRSLGGILSDEGFEPAEAPDGEAALERLREGAPDLVLLDIAMPVMDGMQALPHIREAAPNAVVVMLSGYPFSTAGQGALNAGAHGYLEKSDLVRGLIPRLESILDSTSPTGRS
jgi:CheY-like chemotaxis protein